MYTPGKSEPAQPIPQLVMPTTVLRDLRNRAATISGEPESPWGDGAAVTESPCGEWRRTAVTESPWGDRQRSLSRPGERGDGQRSLSCPGKTDSGH